MFRTFVWCLFFDLLILSYHKVTVASYVANSTDFKPLYLLFSLLEYTKAIARIPKDNGKFTAHMVLRI